MRTYHPAVFASPSKKTLVSPIRSRTSTSTPTKRKAALSPLHDSSAVIYPRSPRTHPYASNHVDASSVYRPHVVQPLSVQSSPRQPHHEPVDRNLETADEGAKKRRRSKMVGDLVLSETVEMRDEEEEEEEKKDSEGEVESIIQGSSCSGIFLSTLNWSRWLRNCMLIMR